ncbi:hypothetical protein [Lactobacillus intestinalis]|jgi:hypothetical protein|uniref:hypothetical protein n=1 Tax=Lactobacillus intestinalis TaxID=151781 RepID=UPI0026EB204A|nr:hypothetical protein [Lactobacillus intestinalis]
MREDRKREIIDYVNELIKTPGTDDVTIPAFEKAFTKEEHDFFMKLLWEKQEELNQGLITVPEPLVG